jgi:hypothetical protein
LFYFTENEDIADLIIREIEENEEWQKSQR